MSGYLVLGIIIVKGNSLYAANLYATEYNLCYPLNHALTCFKLEGHAYPVFSLLVISIKLENITAFHRHLVLECLRCYKAYPPADKRTQRFHVELDTAEAAGKGYAACIPEPCTRFHSLGKGRLNIGTDNNAPAVIQAVVLNRTHLDITIVHWRASLN